MSLTPLTNLPTQSDPSTFNTRAENFINSQLPNLVNEWNTDIQTFNNASTTAQSTTNLLIGLGSKTMTIQTGKSYFAGMRVRIANQTNGWMEGHIVTYSGTSLTVIVDLVGSVTGTFSSWNIFLVPAIDVTAWSNYTPTTTAGTGTITTTTTGGRFKQVGKIVHVNIDCAVTNNGTGSNFIRFTLPVTANVTTFFNGTGRNRTLGHQLQAVLDSSTTVIVQRYDGVYPVTANNQNITISFTYEAA